MKIKNIKFKAKQLNSGKWFEGDLVRLGNRVCIGLIHYWDYGAYNLCPDYLFSSIDKAEEAILKIAIVTGKQIGRAHV